MPSARGGRSVTGRRSPRKSTAVTIGEGVWNWLGTPLSVAANPATVAERAQGAELSLALLVPVADLRNNSVVKNRETAPLVPTTAHEGRDGHTRDAIVGLLMSRGQGTAAEIGAGLGITTTAVRRHLDNLSEAGDVTVAAASAHHSRGRGRPAKEFVLTASGRRQLGQGYDALAVDALRTLREVGGKEAVRAFARRRARAALASVHPAHAGGLSGTAREIAAALSEAGFSADTREVGAGVQICQHHCPVSEVASEFPELCEAEIEVMSQTLGTHVQRLATIANGDRACTTHVPLEITPVPQASQKELR